ncbi:hypothetical protein ACVWWG_004310 [Bradyrhizobium sp. LB7.2]|uniref:hypothetical protein n=1 Tax=Bradyrhizobium sp. LB14.3 TaxID=3156328 RepID=UPI00339B0FB4
MTGEDTLKRVFFISLATLIIGGVVLQMGIMGSGPGLSSTTIALMNLGSINSAGSGAVALVSGVMLCVRWVRRKSSTSAGEMRLPRLSDEQKGAHGSNPPARSSDSRKTELLSGATKNKWHAVIAYDSEIRAAAEALSPYGDEWVERLGDAYFALEQDRGYLPSIVTRLKEEAAKAEDRRLMERFRFTADGEICTEEVRDVLREAVRQGFHLDKEAGGAFLATKDTSCSYLRTIADIRRFGQILRRSANEA